MLGLGPRIEVPGPGTVLPYSNQASLFAQTSVPHYTTSVKMYLSTPILQ
jgi:hypothetical protein